MKNKRTSSGHIVQRQVLYLGEISDNQQDKWRKAIEVFEDGQEQPKQMLLFPEDTPSPSHNEVQKTIHVKLNELQIKNSRQWGACWLFCELWDLQELD